MRRFYQALCVAALAACSESKAPTEIHSPVGRVTISDSVIHPSGSFPGALDARSSAQRIEEVMTQRLTKVRIPADGFSLASDAVHPDIACPPENWNAAKCWLMYTPYLNSDNAYENPAFLYAVNDTSWSTPTGVLNPIIQYPGFGKYNSDPDHAFDPASHRLVQVYRVVADSFNNIMIMSTGDARQWTTPALAFRERNHDAVSPALVIDPDRTAKIWYVRSGEEGCQSKTTTVHLRTAQSDSKNSYEHSTWSAPTAVDMGIPNAVVWHLDVTPIGNDRGYIALVAAYQKGLSCSFSDVWLATSPDGLHWRSYAIPILWRGMKFGAQHALTTWYRGTLRYDAQTDVLDIWPSALVGRNWSIFHVSWNLHDLLSLLESAQSTDLRALGSVMPWESATARAIEMP